MSDQSNVPEVEIEPPVQPRRRIGLYVGLAVLVIALGVAAFFGGRLLNGSVSKGSGLVMLPGGAAMQSIEIESERAEELPETSPEMVGQFVKRDDNVLILSQFQASNGVVVAQGDDGSIEIQGADGPQVEVVTTKDTQLYRDATFDDLKGGEPESGKIQQKVAEANLDEISSGSLVTVWGRKSGDRIIADVIFFTSPFVFQKAQ